MLTSLSDVRESCQQLIVKSFVPVFLPVRDCPSVFDRCNCHVCTLVPSRDIHYMIYTFMKKRNCSEIENAGVENFEVEFSDNG